jgi:hypothetical protein
MHVWLHAASEATEQGIHPVVSPAHHAAVCTIQVSYELPVEIPTDV